MEATTPAMTDAASSVSQWMGGTTVGMEGYETYVWTLVFGFIVAFILAFAVGANDVANSFGTTVGAKVLSLKAACVLASIFETLGAVLLGAKVGETIRKGIIDVTIYNTTEDGRELLMIGEVSAMSGAAIWQLFATLLGLPVSGTHSIVGACIGFSLVAVGSTGINWAKLGFIIASWFISPVLSGFMAVSLYLFINKIILEKANPMRNGLICLPFFYAFTFGINSFSILYSGAPLLGLDHLPLWGIILITLGIMIITGVLVQCIVVPRLRRKCKADIRKASTTTTSLGNSRLESLTPSEKMDNKLNDSGFYGQCEIRKSEKMLLNESDFPVEIDESAFGEDPALKKSLMEYEKELPEQDGLVTASKTTKPGVDSSSYDGGDSDSAYEADSAKSTPKKKKAINDSTIKIEKKEEEAGEEEDEDPPSVRRIFSFLQILTACFGSFAHGGNDVSNAIGPLIALWLIYHSGNVVQKAATPWYLLLYGGAGIVVGLWILGRRVIKTIGNDLTKITPSRGFCIELMTAFTVLIASNVGIPVSTTHCKVGSVVSIGWVRSRSAVQWSMVRNIALAWFVTVPVSGLISAGVMKLLMIVAT